MLETRRLLTPFTVNDSINDLGDNNHLDNICNTTAGTCTLRAAIEQANEFSSADAIDFNLPPTQRTITFGAVVETISNNVTMGTAGMDLVTVQKALAASQFSVLKFGSGVTAEIIRLIVRDGNAQQGGGINNAGTLTITASEIRNNTATATSIPPVIRGGGIFNTGTLTVTNSLVIDNEAVSMAVNTSSSGVGGGGIHNTGTLSIIGSTIKNNKVRSVSGASSTAGIVLEGGGVNNAVGGTLTVSSTSKFEDNELFGPRVSRYGGAAIYSAGTVTISDTEILRNKVCKPGTDCSNGIPQVDLSVVFYGAIYNFKGTIEISTSTVANNELFAVDPGVNKAFRAEGAALRADCLSVPDCVEIYRSTFSDNLAKIDGFIETGSGNNGSGGFGGALAMSGQDLSASPNPEVIIINSTFNGNDVESTVTGDCGTVAVLSACRSAGGVIWSKWLFIHMEWSTVAGNSATSVLGSAEGGGVFVSTQGDGRLRLNSVIFADNVIDNKVEENVGPSAPTPFAFESLGHNLFDDIPACRTQIPPTCTPGPGDQFNKEALLSPLASNGGPTKTMLPSSNSPAQNKGASTGFPSTDQRGLARLVGAATEVGAVECQSQPPPDCGPGTGGIPEPPGHGGSTDFGVEGEQPSLPGITPVVTDSMLELTGMLDFTAKSAGAGSADGETPNGLTRPRMVAGQAEDALGWTTTGDPMKSHS